MVSRTFCKVPAEDTFAAKRRRLQEIITRVSNTQILTEQITRSSGPQLGEAIALVGSGSSSDRNQDLSQSQVTIVAVGCESMGLLGYHQTAVGGYEAREEGAEAA